MTRTLVVVLLLAATALALAVTVSERRLQAAFDEVRHESQAQLERVEGLARVESLLRDLDDAGARVELRTTLAALRLQLPDGDDARRGELERLTALVEQPPSPDGERAARQALDRFAAAEAHARAQANERADVAQVAATTTVWTALIGSGVLVLLLGLALSLRMGWQATQLATAAERLARGNLEAALPPTTGALARLTPAVRKTAAALARREREVEALTAIGQLAARAELDPAGGGPDGGCEIDRRLELARRVIADVLEVRALTLVNVDGERVRRLGTSQAARQACDWPRAGSAVATALGRGDAVVFDVDRGVHPEDAMARAAGARAYAVVPLRVRPGALVVDLGLSALAVAEMRFLGLLAQQLGAQLDDATTARPARPSRVAGSG